MKIVQVDLYHQIDSSHARKMTTWLDKVPGVEKGAEIKLKDIPKVTWTITQVYGMEHDVQEFEWHRKWTNNI